LDSGIERKSKKEKKGYGNLLIMKTISIHERKILYETLMGEVNFVVKK